MTDSPCPICGEQDLRIEYRLEAQEMGTYSIAGAQPKVVAREVPYLVCGNCTVEARAKGY